MLSVILSYVKPRPKGETGPFMIGRMTECIFCLEDASESVSVEHILPESLGNADHTLPRGVVCDACNNYFSRKIEKPLLDSGVFRLLRADRRIANKRGRIPVLPSHDDRSLPSYRTVGRFLGKVGLEALAARVARVPAWREELRRQQELDELRDFVRYDRGEDWPYSFRTLYPVNATFSDGDESYEVLHEYDLLYTVGRELYVVAAILGVEFVLNLGGRLLDGYMAWLREHEYASPLYTGKNAPGD